LCGMAKVTSGRFPLCEGNEYVLDRKSPCLALQERPTSELILRSRNDETLLICEKHNSSTRFAKNSFDYFRPS
jgi:hypothetical protein